MTKIIDILKIPIETLLDFRSATNILFYNIDGDVYANLHKYAQIVYSNHDLLNDQNVPILWKKIRLLEQIKKEISQFNQRARFMRQDSHDLKLSLIQQRVSLPLEYLINRNNDHQLEMATLSSDILSRQIRSRFCALNSIQQKMTAYSTFQFSVGYLSSSRAFIPIAFSNLRNNASLISHMTANLHENFLDEDQNTT